MNIYLLNKCEMCGSDRVRVTDEWIDEDMMQLVIRYKCSKCKREFIYGIDISEIIEKKVEKKCSKCGNKLEECFIYFKCGYIE